MNILHLLCFTAIFFPFDVGATSIVAVWTSDRIVIATDSRRSSLVDGTYTQVCKIRAEGSIWYATAGLYEASIDGFSISNIVHEAYLKSRLQDNVVAFAMMELSTDVANKLNEVRDRVDAVLRSNPNLNFAEIIMVAKEKNHLKAVYRQTDISQLLQSTTPGGNRFMSFGGAIDVIPTTDPNGMQIIAAGRTEAIFEYMANNPAWVQGDDPVSIVRKFIQMEIDRHPSEVGGPIAILTIENDGTVQWKERGACTDGK